MQDEDGAILPALDGSLSPSVWDGMLLYEETRERAEAAAKELKRVEHGLPGVP